MAQSDALLAITTAWAQGSGVATKQLQTDLKKFLDGLDNEARVAVFKVLPRTLTMPHFAMFRAAEEAQETNEVASLLVSTSFEGCGPVENLAEIISYAVARVSDDVLAPHAAAVYEWRCRLLSLAPKSSSIDLDMHAQRAMIYALNAPRFLAFEELLDAVLATKLSRKETQLLAEYLDKVLLEGAGTAGHEAFLAKAGADFFKKLNVANALRKANLLALCPLLAGKSEVTMDVIAKGLRVTADEAEGLVVDAALANVIDVMVDRSTGVVSVKSTMPLRFDKKALQQLLVAIDDNIKFVDTLSASYE